MRSARASRGRDQKLCDVWECTMLATPSWVFEEVVRNRNHGFVKFWKLSQNALFWEFEQTISYMFIWHVYMCVSIHIHILIYIHIYIYICIYIYIISLPPWIRALHTPATRICMKQAAEPRNLLRKHENGIGNILKRPPALQKWSLDTLGRQRHACARPQAPK